MGLRPGTGGEDWYFYMTWDADYIYFGFVGFNWPNNSNNHIGGHFDFIQGGSQVGINNEALGLSADFAFQRYRSLIAKSPGECVPERKKAGHSMPRLFSITGCQACQPMAPFKSSTRSSCSQVNWTSSRPK